MSETLYCYVVSVTDDEYTNSILVVDTEEEAKKLVEIFTGYNRVANGARIASDANYQKWCEENPEPVFKSNPPARGSSPEIWKAWTLEDKKKRDEFQTTLVEYKRKREEFRSSNDSNLDFGEWGTFISWYNIVEYSYSRVRKVKVEV